MPPTRRYAGPLRPSDRTASVPKSYYKKKESKYVKGSNRKREYRGKRQTASIIPVKTYSNKEETIDMEYRCLLDFSNMGGNNGSTPCLIRINMNNPVIGGSAATGDDKIVAVITNTGTGSGVQTPIFHKFALDNKNNLSERLAEYTDIYRDVVVLKSEAEVRVIPKLNPVNPTKATNGRSVMNYWTNHLNTGDFAGLTTPRLVLANAMPEVDVWTIRQQQEGQLINTGKGSPDLETLKADFPNLRMKRLNVTPFNTKGVTFKQSYTPKSQFGLKDWKDNRNKLKVYNAAAANDDQLKSFMYVGIAGRYTAWSGNPAEAPTAHDASPVISEVGLPLMKVEVKVKYRINFSQRLNIEGANDPSPHDEF